MQETPSSTNEPISQQFKTEATIKLETLFQRFTVGSRSNIQMPNKDLLLKASGAFSDTIKSGIKSTKEIPQKAQNLSKKIIDHFKHENLEALGNKTEKLGTETKTVQVFEKVGAREHTISYSTPSGPIEMKVKPIYIKKEQQYKFLGMHFTRKTTQKYAPTKRLGGGSFGQVVQYSPTSILGGKSYALKEAHLTSDTTVKQGDENLRNLHANGLLDGVVVPNKAITTRDGKQGSLQTLYTGTLENRLAQNASKKEKVQVLRQMAKGLHGLHNQRFFHGDLKKENVLTRVKGNLFTRLFFGQRQFHIGDLDGGKFLDKTQAWPDAHTPAYRSSFDRETVKQLKAEPNKWPEEKIDRFKLALDVRALGCLYIEALTNSQTFDGISNSDARAHNISPSVCDFINRMVDLNWEKRPTADEIDAFMSQVKIRHGTISHPQDRTKSSR